MENHPAPICHQCYMVMVSCFLLIGLKLITACAGDASNSPVVPESETSTVNLSIRWHQTSKGEDDGDTPPYKAPLDCRSIGIEQVACEVYDGGGDWIVTGGPWPCTAGKGSVDGILKGPDRTFVALAEDFDGNIYYHGETSGILIEPGVITEKVVIDAYPFVPILTFPSNEADVDSGAFTFGWDNLNNAHQYLIQVDEEPGFDTPVIDETTTANSYAPSGLQPSVEYYWRVRAIDRFNNIGAVSETRRIATSDCTYTISSSANAFAQDGGAGALDVTASTPDCQWIAVSSAEWIQITEGAQGSGNGTISYQVAANPSAADRTGTITAGGAMHTIAQEGIDCGYRISLSRTNFGADGGSGIIDITATAADCPWDVTSNVPWITMDPHAAGSGSGPLTFNVVPNTSTVQRSGTIAIGGETHTITQAGATACLIQIAPEESVFDERGGTGSIDVTISSADCPWSAVSNADWIRITRGATGNVSGTVNYSIDANDTQSERRGTITIGNVVHTVIQSGPAACEYEISPLNAQFEAEGSLGTINVTVYPEDCSWNVSRNVDWIDISSQTENNIGSGTVEYRVLANTTATVRDGIISIAGQNHQVTQLINTSDPQIIALSEIMGEYSLTGFTYSNGDGVFLSDSMAESFSGEMVISSDFGFRMVTTINGNTERFPFDHIIHVSMGFSGPDYIEFDCGVIGSGNTDILNFEYDDRDAMIISMHPNLCGTGDFIVGERLYYFNRR